MAASPARSARWEVERGPEVFAALGAVLRLLSGSSDRAKAAAAVVESGAVPALVRAVRTFTDLLLEPLPLRRRQPPLHPPSPPAPTATAKKDVNIDPEGGGHGCCLCPLAHGPGVRSSITSNESAISVAASESDAKLDIDNSPQLQPIKLAAWYAFDILEQVLLPVPVMATGAIKAAAEQALSCGTVEALLPLLRLLPISQREDQSWRVLRLLLALACFSGSTTTRSSTPTTAPCTGAGSGACPSGGGRATASGSENSLLGPLFSSAFAASPEAINGLLKAAQKLLATPDALTDGTSETLFALVSELLLLHSNTITAGGSSGTGGINGSGALITVEVLRQHAPALVEAAAGVLTGSSPSASWSALLPCTRERRNPSAALTRRLSGSAAAVARGSRFPAQLEAAAARLMKELLAWALVMDEPNGTTEGGAEGGTDREGKAEAGIRQGQSWLPVTQIAAALVQRWLERPGIFEALGEAGVQCLTLAMQLAPPAELWAGERYRLYRVPEG
ncbi:hypothetical protein VOLCADRAFT_94340 [Volvox carteri f. nagariensis]|uniref:Uncharacterized protein n=1 Tax=Volvox carteri f. nagariensis TaxID=3068 RepID=D8U486_VOLCA|nr:uncharacterized protein VOLCADRAFT_94340 [Volvox carteri f. nagariensis]EFJ45458.1 hypothetical protein VOLCADRAFT_94340 [Volvox carteri f. nagariensis]|eukprot:XP_002953485.1 hypothetical protein VOLCADRAFT_94340 [Volvox carteri f. nagariensis]